MVALSAAGPSMIAIGICVALGVSTLCALFLWARCAVGASADEAEEACWSGWEVERPSPMARRGRVGATPKALRFDP